MSVCSETYPNNINFSSHIYAALMLFCNNKQSLPNFRKIIGEIPEPPILYILKIVGLRQINTIAGLNLIII